MNKNIRRVTETAILLALLIALQTLTKPFGQIVTGSCVNSLLAVTVLFSGLPAGIAVALISPVLAFLLGIAPQILTVPAIMVGNSVYVTVLFALAGRKKQKPLCRIAGWLGAALAKFAALYTLVVWLICGVMAEGLLETGVLKAPMLKALPAAFGGMQLVTALIGGAVALLLVPVLKKAMHR
ncbi:MAG: hypothetical protein IJO04_03470 [Oscillospiraceae bacterium]|nr:hypothetical protein [Oscillospiraceae bacterium]